MQVNAAYHYSYFSNFTPKSNKNKSKLRQNTETILLISKVLSESVRPW